MSNMKAEFMALWDGMQTQTQEAGSSSDGTLYQRGDGITVATPFPRSQAEVLYHSEASTRGKMNYTEFIRALDRSRQVRHCAGKIDAT